MKTSIRVLAFGLVLALGVIVISLAVNQVKAQQDVVGELQTKLLQQKVPFKSIRISSYLPLQIEVVLESQSTGTLVSPDDPLFTGVVLREIASARMRGNKIERVQIIINNRQGKQILRADHFVNPALDNTTIVPSKLSDDTLEATVRSQLVLGGFTLDEFTIVHTEDGEQLIHLKLTASELGDLNNALAGPITALSRAVRELREKQGAQIPSYSLEISDKSGNPLLKYSTVFEAAHEGSTWWMAPGITGDWYPRPVPNVTPSVTSPP